MTILTLAIVSLVLGIVAADADGRAASPPTEHETSLPTAHAHNDYRHADPCTGALDLGFTSIEVDVFPVGDDLLVGHEPADLRPDRTIEGLYLDPLRVRCEAAEHPARGPLADGHHLLLLVDIKRDASRALELLLPRLDPLKPWLARVENGRFKDGPIMVVLSGSRPVAQVAAMPDRVVFIDGRLGDLDRNPPVELVPLVSASFGSAVGAALIGAPSESARQRLGELADRAHAQGRRLRFWGHLEDPDIWAALVDAKVDLIGTDDLDRLASWLRAHDPRCRASATSDPDAGASAE